MILSNHTSPQQKIIITLVTILLIIIGLGALVIYPNTKRIIELNNDIHNKRIEAEKIYNRGQNLKFVLQKYQEVKPTIGTLRNIFIQPNKELDLFTSLEKLADVMKISPDLKLANNDNLKQNKKVPLQIRLDGSYHQLIRYLIGLEELDYYINIDTIRLGRNSEKNSSVTSLIIANAYYEP